MIFRSICPFVSILILKDMKNWPKTDNFHRHPITMKVFWSQIMFKHHILNPYPKECLWVLCRQKFEIYKSIWKSWRDLGPILVIRKSYIFFRSDVFKKCKYGLCNFLPIPLKILKMWKQTHFCKKCSKERKGNSFHQSLF